MFGLASRGTIIRSRADCRTPASTWAPCNSLVFGFSVIWGFYATGGRAASPSGVSAFRSFSNSRPGQPAHRSLLAVNLRACGAAQLVKLGVERLAVW